MVSLKAIDESKNISLLTDDDSFGDASALYTYILRLHKKVSLVNQESQMDRKLSCVPWWDKVKKTLSSSSDLIIDLKTNKQPLYDLFKKSTIKINGKMATALYASYLQKPDCYSDKKSLLALSELILLGAEHDKCMQYLKKSYPLSLFRIKAILLATLVLYDNAKVAFISLNKDDLQKTGASMSEVKLVMLEVLSMVHVQKIVLVNEEDENKLIKII